MATPVRSRGFFGPVALAANTNTTVYTVPAARTAIVRSIWVTNLGAAAVFFAVRVDAATAAATVWAQSVPAFTSVETPPELVLNPGQVLILFAGAVGPLQAAGYGSLLNGAPS